MPLTMSLFDYLKLKCTKLVAAVGQSTLSETAKLLQSPVNKRLAKPYYPMSCSSVYVCTLQELKSLLFLYRLQQKVNTYIFFSIYPTSAH